MALAVFASSSGFVRADPSTEYGLLEIKMFGHDVQIRRDDNDRELVVDGTSIFSDFSVTLTDEALVSGVPVVIGEISSGGNCCAPSVFVMSFEPGKPARIDGPIEPDGDLQRKIEPNQIVLASTPEPDSDGQSWIWRVGVGLQALPPTPFRPDEHKGWAQVKAHLLQSPYDIFSYGEINRQLNEILGEDKDYFPPYLRDRPEGKYLGDDYFGTGCVPHMCLDVGAMIYLSTSTKKVYVAWKPEDGPVEVRPNVKEWPKKARKQLKEWAAPWW